MMQSLRTQPNEQGCFAQFGGQYVSETLMPLLNDLQAEYSLAAKDADFQAELQQLQQDYVGRPTALYFAPRLTAYAGGAKIYLKREDLNHTGAHKINNCIGQALLAKRMGKRRLIAETGAGMHGVAAATVAALLDMECVVFMGARDMERQAANVERMRLFGAQIVPVHSGSQSLKDAMNEALRDWVTHVDTTFYVIGTVAGPHPYPQLVRDFQTIIGRETREQILQKEGRLPDALIACIGGGSNALGLFHPFLDEAVEMIGVEAGGHGLSSGEHAASLSGGSVGVLHGNRTFLLQDVDGQITEAHSLSAGLDYPGIGPEHAWLHSLQRVHYVAIDDREALQAFQLCCRLEGIIPALESAHAVAEALKQAAQRPSDEVIIVNLSGRGDKDMATVAPLLNAQQGEPVCSA